MAETQECGNLDSRVPGRCTYYLRSIFVCLNEQKFLQISRLCGILGFNQRRKNRTPSQHKVYDIY